MKKFLQVSVTTLAFLCAPISRAKPQEKKSLRLERAIPMSNVKGHRSHGYGRKGQATLCRRAGEWLT
jgi:hypothetical protein